MSAAVRRSLIRWASVIVVLIALASVPALVRARPAPAQDGQSAAQLLARLRTAGGMSYVGYAESHGTLSVPDVAQLGDLPSLLGDTTKMRVWSRAGTGTRVDVVDDLGETDTYTGPGQEGSLVWASQERRLTVVHGAPPVRAPRAGDVLPTALASRLAAGIVDSSVTRIASHRIAGRSAQGLRVRPPGASTIDHVDLWIDPKTGLCLQAQVFAQGSTRPSLSTAFLSFSVTTPKTTTVTFVPPLDAKVRDVDANDLQGLLGRLRGFPYPSTVAGLSATQDIEGGTHVATYGDALRTLVVVRLSPDDADKLSRSITASTSESDVTDIPDAKAQEVSTPLVNALLVRAGFRDFLLAGTVPAATLRTAYDELAAVTFARPPAGQGAPA